MTFSVAGRCRRTGEFGIAIATSSMCVGARCVWVRQGVGAVSSQSLTNPALGKFGLDLLETGMAPSAALERVVETEGDHARFRQLGMIGSSGLPVAHTGGSVLEHHGEALVPDCVATGNLLASAGVVDAIVGAFEAASGKALAERLLRGIEAGLAAGGEWGEVHSAALQVKAGYVWPICDLRIDWHASDPVGRLRALWADYEPLLQSYIQRALAPSASPSFGVPGPRG